METMEVTAGTRDAQGCVLSFSALPTPPCCRWGKGLRGAAKLLREGQ